MKHSATYILPLLLLAAPLLGGCSDDYDPALNLTPSLTGRYLRSSGRDISVPSAQPYSVMLIVECRNTPWAFRGTPSWLTLTPSSSSESARVTLDVEENLDATAPRTAIFNLSSTTPDWVYSQAMSVTQPTPEPVLAVNATQIGFGGGTGHSTVEVEANCSWTASTSSEWISLTSDVAKGVLTITAEPNSTNSYRNATVLISYGSSQSVTISVSQSPAYIYSSDATLTFDDTASAYEIEVNAEAPWTASSSYSWISILPDKGDEGTTTVSIEAAPNTSDTERTGYVAFYIGDYLRKQLTVVQKGIYIEGDASIEFGYGESSKPLSLKSNTSWSVLSKSEWLTLSKESGEGNAEITVTAADNPSVYSRSGQIVFGREGLSVTHTVSVRQTGKSFSHDATLIEFSDKGGTSSFRLTTDAAWTSTASADWFSASPASGHGDAEITVTALPNNTTQERAGTLTFSYADRTVDINLHQLAKYLNIDSNNFTFPSAGGSHTVSLSGNGEWSASVEEGGEWLHLSETSGSGDATLTITADDNASVNRRSGIVVISAPYTQGVRINVEQEARFLSLSAENILFFSKGGTSEIISVTTNGKYSVSCDAGWLTINRLTDGSFSLFAAPNYSVDQRKTTVSVALTDLKEGSYAVSLPVIQAGEGGSFVLQGYPSDKDWDAIGSGSLVLTIKGYTTDKNWDLQGLGTLKVNVTGYKGDGNWDTPANTGADITGHPYGNDKDWDTPSNTGADITGHPYGNDKNWNN